VSATLEQKIPAWFRATAGGQADELARAAAQRDLHDRLHAEAAAVTVENEKERRAKEAAVGAAKAKAEKLHGPFALAQREQVAAATELRLFERAAERRLLQLDREMKATADPRIEIVAGVVMDIVEALRMNRCDPPAGETGGECAMRLQELALRELRERAAVAPTAEGALILAQVQAEVLANLGGVTRSYWAEKIARAFEEEGL